MGYTEEEIGEMTPRKLTLLYREYEKEYRYRDSVFVALYQFFGINEKSEDEDSISEDVI